MVPQFGACVEDALGPHRRRAPRSVMRRCSSKLNNGTTGKQVPMRRAWARELAHQMGP